MSHKATAWVAGIGKHLDNGEFRVLFALADRHNPDYGCFPSQELLSIDCNMSRRSINRHLNGLEERGLIKRVASKNINKQYASTEYTLMMNLNKPNDIADSPNEDDALVPNEVEPCAISGKSHVPICHTNYVSLTSNITSNNNIIDGFDDFWRIYPRKISKKNALKAYQKALKASSSEEILLGAERYAKSVKGNDEKFIAHAATWLNGERWNDEVKQSATDETLNKIMNGGLNAIS